MSLVVLDPLSAGSTCAVVATDNRVKVWDASTGSLRCQLAASDHLKQHYTCVAFGPGPVSAGARGGRAKRAKRTGSARLALGTEKGAVLVWDVERAELLHRLGGKGEGHRLAVTSVAFSDDGQTLYSGSADKHVIAWSLRTGQVVNKWRVDKHAVRALALSPDSSRVCTAYASLKVWDAASQRQLASFVGHAAPVVCLAWSRDGAMLVSGADDRTLLLWSCVDISAAPSATAGNAHALPQRAIAMLTLDTPPRSVAWPHTDSTQLVAVSQSGVAHVFPAKAAKKPVDARVTVAFDTSDGDDEDDNDAGADNDVRTPVLAAFLPTQDSLMLAAGVLVAPSFRRVDLSDAEDGHVSLSSASTDAGVVFKQQKLLAAGALTTQTQMSSHATAAVTDGNAVPGSIAATAAAAAGPVAAGARVPHAGVPASLQQQVDSLVAQHAEETKAAPVPKAQSLSSVLVTALQSDDTSMLEYCLSVCDSKIVSTTVRRLPNTLILPFLTSLVAKFQAKPARGVALVVWIRAVLTEHASYLAGLPNLVEALSPLYQAVDSRVSVFARLLKLTGRLDLMFSQIDRGAGTSAQREPMDVYQDSSDDEVDLAVGGAVHDDDDDDDDDDDEEEWEDGDDDEDSDDDDGDSSDDDDGVESMEEDDHE